MEFGPQFIHNAGCHLARLGSPPDAVRESAPGGLIVRLNRIGGRSGSSGRVDGKNLQQMDGSRSLQNDGLRNVGPYPIADAIVKIGRYMAITMNPMIVPKTTIMIGSKSEVMAATA